MSVKFVAAYFNYNILFQTNFEIFIKFLFHYCRLFERLPNKNGQNKYKAHHVYLNVFVKLPLLYYDIYILYYVNDYVKKFTSY